MDAVEPCDVLADLAVDPIPDSAVADADVCVSVAAVVDTFAPAHSMSSRQWSRDIDINLTGAFRVCATAGSGASWRYQVWRVGWETPTRWPTRRRKSFCKGMIRTVAIENCALGITANCVLPGFIATPGLLALPERNRNRILAAIPSARFGHPDEVANVVAFLARDDAGCITAQEIGIAGGLELNTFSIVGAN
jgi:NAD(P)-dependent dehydrogenase (short-subunit alcohol dehydrogenase family)